MNVSIIPDEQKQDNRIARKVKLMSVYRDICACIRCNIEPFVSTDYKRHKIYNYTHKYCGCGSVWQFVLGRRITPDTHADRRDVPVHSIWPNKVLTWPLPRLSFWIPCKKKIQWFAVNQRNTQSIISVQTNICTVHHCLKCAHFQSNAV